MNDFFVYTEIVNCGKIGKIALKTFIEHHPSQKVHVYGTQKDYEWVQEFDKKILWHDVDREFPLFITYSKQFPFIKFHKFSDYFLQGHMGTAQLWARLIQSRSEKYFVHFDSDVVFKSEVIPDFIKAFRAGYDLIGPRRHYRDNPNNMDEVRHLPDVVQTYIFGFNKTMLNQHSLRELAQMCRGAYNPLNHPIIDFFDPVSFEILSNGGKIKFLTASEYGGFDKKGKPSKHSPLNLHLGYGSKLMHFSGVGSGLNFIQNKDKLQYVPKSYQDFALRKYALYNKLFYNQDCGIEYNKNSYKELKKVLGNI